MPSRHRLNRLAMRISTLSCRRSRKALRGKETPGVWKARSPNVLLSPLMSEKPTRVSIGRPERNLPSELIVKPQGKSTKPLTRNWWRASSLEKPYSGPRLKVLSRSEEHTSELQSPMYLVCRLLLEKK